jgi:hypothetical protein
LVKDGYKPITCVQSLADFADTDIKTFSGKHTRNDIGSFIMKTVSARTINRSIYTQFRDPSLIHCLNQRDDQLETLDISSVSKNFDKLGDKFGHLD